MKKIIPVIALVFILVIAWKEENPIPAANTSVENNKIGDNYFRDTASSEKAKRMFNKFKSDFKRGQTIVSKFSRTELISILDSMQTDSVIFFVAMHEDNDPKVKDKGVVLMQVQMPVPAERSTSKAALYPYAFLSRFYYLTGTVCPPPSDCVIQ